MIDWLEDPLMILKESSLCYRKHNALSLERQRLWESFHFATRLNLEGADYFCRMALGMASMPESMGLESLAYKHTKWSLAAFFFELMSAYDILLQELNVVYGINSEMEKVCWSSIKDKIGSEIARLMSEEWTKEWFKKARHYRITATHHAYIPTGSESGGCGDMPWDYDEHLVRLIYVDAYGRSTKEDIREACPAYLKQMIEHIHVVWQLMRKCFDDQPSS